MQLPAPLPKAIEKVEAKKEREEAKVRESIDHKMENMYGCKVSFEATFVFGVFGGIPKP